MALTDIASSPCLQAMDKIRRMTTDSFERLLASDHAPDIRVIAMPADTNPAGDIFGGWLMANMDLAAGNAAARRARGRCATVAVDRMSFHRPVLVGDEVSFFADILKVGHTSLVIHVKAFRRARESEESGLVTEATFTFVAIDENRRPRPVQG